MVEERKVKEDEIKERKINEQKEEVEKTRPGVIAPSFIPNNNISALDNSMPTLRPRIVFGNSDAQYFRDPKEVKRANYTTERMLIWNNQTESNSNENSLYKKQLVNEKIRYGRTINYPKMEIEIGDMMKSPATCQSVFQDVEPARNETVNQATNFLDRPLLKPENSLRYNKNVPPLRMDKGKLNMWVNQNYLVN